MANFEDFNFEDFKELVDSTKSDLEKLKVILIDDPDVFMDYVNSTNIVSAFDTLAPFIEDMELRYNLGRYIFSAVEKSTHPEEVNWSIDDYYDGSENVQTILDSYDNDELAKLLRYYFEHVKTTVFNRDDSYVTVIDSKRFDFSDLISSIRENCNRMNHYFLSDPITFKSFVDNMRIEEIYEALSLSGMQSKILICFDKLIKNFSNEDNKEFDYAEYLKLLGELEHLILQRELDNWSMNICSCIVRVAEEFKASRGWEYEEDWMLTYFLKVWEFDRPPHQK